MECKDTAFRSYLRKYRIDLTRMECKEIVCQIIVRIRTVSIDLTRMECKDIRFKQPCLDFLV